MFRSRFQPWRPLGFRARFASGSSSTSPRPQKSFIATVIGRLRQKHPHIEPASLIASFLVLHEITAVLPLFALFATLRHLEAGDAVFHNTKNALEGTWAEKWIAEAESKASRMLKNGYLASNPQDRQHPAESNQKNRIQSSDKLGGALADAAASYILIKVWRPKTV